MDKTAYAVQIFRTVDIQHLYRIYSAVLDIARYDYICRNAQSGIALCVCYGAHSAIEKRLK